MLLTIVSFILGGIAGVVLVVRGIAKGMNW
jgi:hypothetical protein